MCPDAPLVIGFYHMPPSGLCRDLLVATISVMATLVIMRSFPLLSVPQTTAGRPKSRGDRAFVLSVGLHFQSVAAAEDLLGEWAKIADYCYKNERFLYQYEVSQSDKQKLRYVVVERYRSKEDYLQAHRRSAAFEEFRPKMKAMQERGDVEVSGDSYYELGIGFT